MSDRGDEETRGRPHLVLGVLLTFLGGLGIGVVIAADIGGTPTLDALAFRLGLAWGPLLLGAAQVVFLVGLWLLWRGRRSRRGG